METSAGAEALAAGRRRELNALENENDHGEADMVDALRLRRAAAIHQTVFPGPHPDALAGV